MPSRHSKLDGDRIMGCCGNEKNITDYQREMATRYKEEKKTSLPDKVLAARREICATCKFNIAGNCRNLPIESFIHKPKSRCLADLPKWEEFSKA